jgi:hypothetical protein
METGTRVPSDDKPSARIEAARTTHADAVQAFGAAQRNYVDEVNAIALPRLMSGGKVRVTDLDEIEVIRAAAQEAAGTFDQIEALVAEVVDHRNMRCAIAAKLGIKAAATVLVNAAADVARLTGEAAS